VPFDAHSVFNSTCYLTSSCLLKPTKTPSILPPQQETVILKLIKYRIGKLKLCFRKQEFIIKVKGSVDCFILFLDSGFVLLKLTCNKLQDTINMGWSSVSLGIQFWVVAVLYLLIYAFMKTLLTLTFCAALPMEAAEELIGKKAANSHYTDY
jgi:hypothetical protein